MTGRVVFVGAGPGAADLITVRGARVIAEADIIIWASSLVHPAIVADAKPGAVLVDSAGEALEDTELHYRRAAREELLVARVHTGDPSIYGATAEQVRICRALGLDVETVPGVSAFSAAAARMNAEITLPEVCQSFILTRLEGGRTPMPPKETVRSFAAHGATMALYLSAARNKQLQDELLAGGYAPGTPCIIGYRVSWPDEKMMRCTLSTLSTTMREHKLWKHTVVLVGPAMAEAPEGSRSHLYHPGFRHEYRSADPEARRDLRERGAGPVTGQAENHPSDPREG
ncbi:precorrin-4 C(11)-methyltransferase [Tessaracoccus antarcticus]|uniref:Precorrin-4 C(11)-methyltransferase n=1 Tax=Tessaracoccus antarcticus TaxID=2479848 RepID=A0A3M0G9I7_9ACTN|nr:precorrin-4 C(11)-methyltransferase [Tessaracoccus antarcticus]RMB61640.1 precorrin-4 C(11)-methyltransferase [Tessaracoccus antarcticus]